MAPSLVNGYDEFKSSWGEEFPDGVIYKPFNNKELRNTDLLMKIKHILF